MPPIVPVSDLETFCHAALAAVGADAATARDCTSSIMHGSLHGVESHGVRLLPHYVKALQGGRLNKTPELRFTLTHMRIGEWHQTVLFTDEWRF